MKINYVAYYSKCKTKEELVEKFNKDVLSARIGIPFFDEDEIEEAFNKVMKEKGWECATN